MSEPCAPEPCAPSCHRVTLHFANGYTISAFPKTASPPKDKSSEALAKFERDLQMILKETGVYRRLAEQPQPFFPSLYAFCEDPPTLYLEAMQGDMVDFTARRFAFEEPARRTFVCDIRNALRILHVACSLCHMDLKPDNILFHFDSKSECGYRFKLCDFGFATPVSTSCNATYGSAPYVAPEVLICAQSNKTRVYDAKKADAFSFACTLVALTIPMNESPNDFLITNRGRDIACRTGGIVCEIVRHFGDVDPNKRGLIESTLLEGIDSLVLSEDANRSCA